MRLINLKSLGNAVDICYQEQKSNATSPLHSCLNGKLHSNCTCLADISRSFLHIFFEALLHWTPYAIFAIILITVTIPLLSKCREMARCNTLTDRRAIFFTLFEDRIRREFCSQSAETMSTIVTAVSHILRRDPERPSILLCLASSDAKNTCIKIARATASAVMSSFRKPKENMDEVTLDCSNYESTDDFWKFYEDMTQRMSRQKVVVLKEFEKINPQVATSLCHLANDTYAPFPQSIIIICLDIGTRFDHNNLKRQAPVTLAETFLGEKWDYSLDNAAMTELLGRLTGRAVLIEKELVQLRRLAGSLPAIQGYLGPPPKLRRRRQIARSEMLI